MSELKKPKTYADVIKRVDMERENAAYEFRCALIKWFALTTQESENMITEIKKRVQEVKDKRYA